MSAHAYTEDQLVEQPAIGLFAELGWTTVSAVEEIFGAKGTLLRETSGDVVLLARLRAALTRLNPLLPTEAIAAAVDELTRDRSAMTAAAANREVYLLLKEGIRVSVLRRLPIGKGAQLEGGEGTCFADRNGEILCRSEQIDAAHLLLPRRGQRAIDSRQNIGRNVVDHHGALGGGWSLDEKVHVEGVDADRLFETSGFQPKTLRLEVPLHAPVLPAGRSKGVRPFFVTPIPPQLKAAGLVTGSGRNP